MDTPWGRLGDLDLTDHDLAADILCADKHQLLEGLVVECLFDQIVAALPAVAGCKVQALDVDSVVVDTRRQGKERWLGFVWARSLGTGLGRYLMALEKCLTPYLVRYQGGEFLAVRVQHGQRQTRPRPLPELLRELSGGREVPFQVDASVKDRKRQKQAFWGFISESYRERLAERVVLPRILINCAIQPHFRSVWNLDRVFVVGDELWLFEIKHKYPMQAGALEFGINVGELGLLGRLAEANIRCLHSILVKPCWSREVGSMYLLNDLNQRARAALVAVALDRCVMERVLRQPSRRSGVHTSITGVSGLAFKSMAAASFSKLGLLSDPAATLASRMLALMSGAATEPVQDAWLHALRSPQAGPGCAPWATMPCP